MYIRGCSISDYDIQNDYLSSHPGNNIAIRRFYHGWETIRIVIDRFDNPSKPKPKLSHLSKKSISYYKYNKISFSMLARALE